MWFCGALPGDACGVRGFSARFPFILGGRGLCCGGWQEGCRKSKFLTDCLILPILLVNLRIVFFSLYIFFVLSFSSISLSLSRSHCLGCANIIGRIFVCMTVCRCILSQKSNCLVRCEVVCVGVFVGICVCESQLIAAPSSRFLCIEIENSAHKRTHTHTVNPTNRECDGGGQAGWLWTNDNTLWGANTRWTGAKGSARDFWIRGPNEADNCVILAIATRYVFRGPQHWRRHFGIGRTRSLVFDFSASFRWNIEIEKAKSEATTRRNSLREKRRRTVTVRQATIVVSFTHTFFGGITEFKLMESVRIFSRIF